MLHRSTSRPDNARAFTIVEMLVVVGMIAVLIGFLLPTLASVRNRSKKTNELSNLRQVNTAWALYGQSFNDAALPGFLTKSVQDDWKVRWEYPDGTKMDRAGTMMANDGEYVDRNIASPWTWRLMEYLEYDYELIHGYSSNRYPDPNNPNRKIQIETEMIGLSDTSDPDQVFVAESIAVHPAFGYNGYYLGGYWELSSDGEPRAKFTDAKQALTGESVNVIARTISTVRRPSEMVAFCSSSEQPMGPVDNLENDEPGFHLVVPPFLAQERMYRKAGIVPPSGGSGAAIGGGSMQLQSQENYVGEPGDVVVMADRAPVPFGRYTGAAAVLHADGHTDTPQPDTLIDQNRFLNISENKRNATGGFWRHTEN